MSQEPWREALEKVTLWDLPIGVYVVDHNRVIVEHNERVERIFGQPVRGTNIGELYPQIDQARLFAALDQAESRGEPLERQVLPLQIDGKTLFVLDFAKTLHRGTEGRPPALLCCITDFTEESRFRRLFERLPTGVYQLDADDHLVYANQRLADIYGFPNVEAVLGRKADDIFVEPERAHELRREIEAKGEVVDFRAELVKPSGETFWASIFATAIRVNGQYAGREGAVIDVTREEQYAELIEEMPIGLYRVRKRDGHETIEHCNRPFAQMAGAEKPEEIIGQPIRAFHRNPELYARLRQELDERGEATATLPIATGRWVDVRTRDIRRRDGTRTGARVGGALDVTDRHEEIGELREDVGKTLHTYSAALISVGHAIRPVLRSLGEDPFVDRTVIPGWTESLLVDFEPVREDLVRQLKRLLIESRDSVRGAALTRPDWNRLESQLAKLYKERLDQLHAEARYPALRQVALEIADILARAEPGHVSREALKAVEQHARELARLGSLLALHVAQATITEMSYQVRSLREFVTRSSSPSEVRTRFAVGDWIRQVVGEHAEFAQSRGVSILQVPVDDSMSVSGSKRDLVRCLGNLLHNAIKYSWFKTEPKVRLEALRGPTVVKITVQNDGIPIHPDEQNLVFRIGFRGRFAPDRRRTGTGIGLADSHREAKAHGGDLTVKSEPAPGSRANDFSQPFITQFTLILPLAN